MLLFTVTRNFYGKDLNQEVKEYYLAETEEKFISVTLEKRGLLNDEVITEKNRPRYKDEQEFQEALQEWQLRLTELVRDRKVEEIDHDFWREDVTWTSTEVTDAETDILKKFSVLK